MKPKMHPFSGKPMSCKKCGHKLGIKENVLKHLMKYHLERFLYVWYSYTVSEQTQNRIFNEFFWNYPDFEDDEEIDKK